MLAVEALALQTLKAAAKHAPGDPVTVAGDVATRLAPAVLMVRKASRRKGAERFAVELQTAGADVAIPQLRAPDDADRLAAERAARGYSDALLKQAQTWMREHDAAQRNPILQAEVSRLEMIAASEVASAFNEERARLEYAIAEEQRGNWVVPVVKIWSAEMESATTCAVCRRLNGETRLWGIDFSQHREPGKVHPRCRCYTRYIAAPTYITRARKAA